MNTPLKYKLITLLTLFMSACATEQYAKPEHLSPAESSIISITRPSALWNDTIAVPIYVNGAKIGMLANGATLTWQVRPGITTVDISGNRPAIKLMHQLTNTKVQFNAHKGKTYHAQVTTPYQVNMAIPTFEIRLVK